MSVVPAPTQTSTRRRRGRPSKQSKQTNSPVSTFAPDTANNPSVAVSAFANPQSPAPPINKVHAHAQGRGRPRLRSSIRTDSLEHSFDKQVKGNTDTMEHKTESNDNQLEKMQTAIGDDTNLPAHAAETVQSTLDIQNNKDEDRAAIGVGGDAHSNGSVDKEHMPKQRDIFCWSCHRETGRLLACKLCPRIFHVRCLTAQSEKEKEPWTCPECEVISKNSRICAS